MRRPDDWFRQALLDLEAAHDMLRSAHYEWTCFLSQQAAERAVKALHESEGAEAWGHTAAGLLGQLPAVPADVLDAAKALDRHYIPTRYPNTHPQGAPGDLYTRRDADAAEQGGPLVTGLPTLIDAETVIEHVRGQGSQA